MMMPATMVVVAMTMVMVAATVVVVMPATMMVTMATMPVPMLNLLGGRRRLLSVGHRPGRHRQRGCGLRGCNEQRADGQ